MLTRLEFSRDADALFAHVEGCWQAARGGRQIPKRQDLSPSKLGRALPFVSLIDVIQGSPLDFQYRLIGQHLITNIGQNLTGKRILDLPPGTPTGRPLYAAYVKCVETSQASHVDVAVLNMNGTKRHIRGLVLPLGEEGRVPDSLLGAALFLD